MSEKPNNKLVVVLGPTSSGKSELAVKIARNFNGEVISADSRQVYRGLDLGSGKVPRDIDITKDKSHTNKDEYLYQGIRHRLISIISPQKTFTVADYKKLGFTAIKKVIDAGKLPIIAGGTGYYIDSLLYERQIPKTKPNEKLRGKLEKKSAKELFAILERQDPRRAKTIDRMNKRRLIRALEIIASTGDAVPPALENPWEHSRELKKMGIGEKDVLIIGMEFPLKKLEQRIKARLYARLKEGMLNEARGLHKKGLSWRRMDELGLEYRYMSRFLTGKISEEEMEHKILVESRRYAKRQMTWWQKNPNILWIKSSTQGIKAIKAFLQS